jgi:mannose-6-phosphate isomerase-like protein (cupin superfamily)
MAAIDLSQLPHTDNAHDFVGADHDVPVSLILVHARPGAGPAVHRHPYPEIFVIEAGRATFVVNGVETVVEGRKIVLAPSNSWHGFTNTGAEELRLTAIHTAPAFDTEWAVSPDPTWVSAARERKP